MEKFALYPHMKMNKIDYALCIPYCDSLATCGVTFMVIAVEEFKTSSCPQNTP